MKVMNKKIMIIWGMLIFLICTTLLLIGFKYKDTEYDSYEVTLSWKYKKDLDYDDEKIFTIIKSDKKL